MITEHKADYPFLSWVDNQGQLGNLTVVDRVFIGRVCQAVPAAKRIIVNEPNVSRDHATISRHAHQLVIKDTSRNGTRINGVRVSPGSEYSLKENDCIEIGSIRVTVKFPVSESGQLDEDEEQTTRIISINETVTHLVADVRGFSRLAQRSESKEVFDLVSDLFQLLTEAVHQHHGTVKDYAGDAIYAFWEHDDLFSSKKALNACLAVKTQYSTLNEYLAQRPEGDSLSNIALGWGVSTGASTLSHYGVRQDNLALVGDSTNLAFRLAAMANNTLSQPVVICATTASLVGEHLGLTDLGAVETKGRAGKEQVFSYDLA